MPRKRKDTDRWMPPRVYRGKAAYEWHPAGGGAVRLCALSSTPSQVWAAYEQAVAARATRFTLAELARLYFASPQYAALAPRTRQDYRAYSEKPLAVWGHIAPDTVTAPDVRRYMDMRGAVSRVRANRERTWLRVVYSWGFERGLVTTIPTQGVRTFKEPPRERYITDPEYQAVRERAPPVVQVAMDLSYLCAARQQDVLKLRWQDVDEAKGIYIQQGKTRVCQWKLWTPALRAAVEQAKKLPGVRSVWVVHTRTGQRFSSSGFKAMFIRARDKAMEDGVLLEPFTFHDIKAKGISDYEGDKRRFSGHRTQAMVAVYDRKPAEVEALNPKKGGQ